MWSPKLEDRSVCASPLDALYSFLRLKQHASQSKAQAQAVHYYVLLNFLDYPDTLRTYDQIIQKIPDNCVLNLLKKNKEEKSFSGRNVTIMWSVNFFTHFVQGGSQFKFSIMFFFLSYQVTSHLSGSRSQRWIKSICLYKVKFWLKTQPTTCWANKTTFHFTLKNSSWVSRVCYSWVGHSLWRD